MPRFPIKVFAYSVLSIHLLVFSTRCSSNSVELKYLNRPLGTLRLAVRYALRDSVKNVSQNSRTYYSNYHIPGMNPKILAVNKKQRGKVIMTIHGSQRPYRISVLYSVEKRSSSGYSFDYYDKRLAKKYLNKVAEYLVSRPEQRDVIDDFRPY